MEEKNVTLMEYLQMEQPRIKIVEPGQMSKEHKVKLPSSEIHTIEPWQDFNLDYIIGQHRKALSEVKVSSRRWHQDIRPIDSLSNLQWSLPNVIDIPVGKILRITFKYLTAEGQMEGKKPVRFYRGRMAPSLEALTPDLSYVLEKLDQNESNRAAGVIKGSWKWDTKNTVSGKSWYLRERYRPMIGEVGAHMCASGCRYGFILSDHTMVAIRKVAKGGFQISAPILWETSGTEEEPRLTLMMALWYLGMLAANETGEDKWQDDSLEY